MDVKVTDSEQKILDCLRSAGKGLTSPEIADRAKMLNSNVSTRMARLCALGLVKKIQCEDATGPMFNTKGEPIYRTFAPVVNGIQHKPSTLYFIVE